MRPMDPWGRHGFREAEPKLLTEFFKNLFFDIFLGAGVVSIGFALKFPYGRSNVREFSPKFTNFSKNCITIQLSP